MTHPTSHRSPGRFLLRIASLVFEDSIVESVVAPTIADLQAEVGRARTARHALAARARGYTAFWTLVALAPFSAHLWPRRHARAMTLPAARGGAGLWLVLATVLGFMSPALTPWTAIVLAGGSMVAVVIHAWYSRHPSLLPSPNGERRPEINLSAIPVGGNIGGLIFMAGSMAILVSGLPMWRWFFGAALAGGVLTAGLVYVWHTARPAHGLPQNRIVLR